MYTQAVQSVRPVESTAGDVCCRSNQFDDATLGAYSLCDVGVHLIGVYLIDIYLMSIHLINGCLIGVYLTGVHLMGVYLISVIS
jgi:hypothetical protein